MFLYLLLAPMVGLIPVWCYFGLLACCWLIGQWCLKHLPGEPPGDLLEAQMTRFDKRLKRHMQDPDFAAGFNEQDTEIAAAVEAAERREREQQWKRWKQRGSYEWVRDGQQEGAREARETAREAREHWEQMQVMRRTVIDDFMRYCDANPDLRFWQAVAAWSGQEVYVGRLRAPGEPSLPDDLEQARTRVELAAALGLTDSFYLEGRTP